jgi:hypothetical protein
MKLLMKPLAIWLVEQTTLVKPLVMILSFRVLRTAVNRLLTSALGVETIKQIQDL